ncbi:maleylpyruvate isomerase N-terminal domain-containing protein [Glycomyces salinus]|uniref:maleylpyruvate isomerase N-terminal domain-containing protein n=1 Tax=Glycomyces salinus TaxID=980294 RepID=UPI0018EB6736|nr:maleylpyruvate isomerase N-terminal domain-containing protein [Glycomyces salinus]
MRSRYVSAAATALDLVESDPVAAAWERESALEGFTVGGLAGHIAAQVHSTREALDGDFAGKERIGLFEHFERAAWRGADLGNEINTRVREGGQAAAEAGPAALVADTRRALAAVEAALPGRDGDETSGNPYWAYATSLDDFLVTRILEFVVHSDDLACSVGSPMPVFDAEVFDTAAWVLTRLSAGRHGQAALVRALSRSERAGGDITAL